MTTHPIAFLDPIMAPLYVFNTTIALAIANAPPETEAECIAAFNKVLAHMRAAYIELEMAKKLAEHHDATCKHRAITITGLGDPTRN